jgi:PAS domain S-box-containing protein
MSENLESLRKRASELFNVKDNHIPEVWDSFEKLLEEYHIHKIEIDLQQDELVKANTRLEKQNIKLDNLFEYAPVPYFLLDINGTIIQLNAMASQILGSDKHNLLNTPFTRYIHRDSQDPFYFYWQKINENQNLQKSLEIKLKSFDGNWSYYLLNCISYQEADQLTFRISATDISPLKEAEILRNSEKRYRQLFENLINGLIIFTTVYKKNKLVDFTLEKFNPSFKKITGIDPVNLEGQSFTEMLPEHRVIMKSILMDTILCGENQKIQNLPLKNGKIVNVNSFVADENHVALIFVDVTVQHTAFENLDRTRELYENVVNTQTEMIARILPDSRFIFFNKAFCKLLSVEDECSLSGKKLLDMMPDQCAIVMKNNIQKAIEKNQPVTFELEYEPDGQQDQIKHIRWSCHPISNGEVRELQLVGQDITEQREAEKGLMQSEETLKTIIKILPVGICLFDNNGKFINANPASEKLLGYQFDELFNLKNVDKAWNVINTDYTPFPVDQFPSVRALAGETVVNVEMGLITRQADIKWLSVSATPIASSPLGAVVVCSDITERFQAHATSEEKFKNLVQNSSDAIIIINSQGKIVEWNAGCENLFGEIKEHALKEEIWTFLEPFIPDHSLFKYKELYKKENVLKAIREGESKWFNQMVESEIIDNKNVAKSVQAVIYPVHTSTGNMLGIIARDITKSKETIKMLEIAKIKAEEANITKSEFLANISHEIRTPLNAILGFSDILKDFTVTDEKFNQYLAGIQRSGKALMGLINDILDLSRMEAGRMIISPGSINIRSIVEDVKQIFLLNATNKGINLVATVDAEIPKLIRIDGIRLRQVLFNLVGNAVKYTHKGEIHIKAHTTENPENNELIDLTIKVKDTGVGIDPEHIAVIFEPFINKIQAGHPKQEGSGLGLSISRRLVELMNGTIEVESKPGAGSEFCVFIPGIEVLYGQETLNPSEKLSSRSHGVTKNYINKVKLEIEKCFPSQHTLKEFFQHPVWTQYKETSDILDFEELDNFANNLKQLAKEHQMEHLTRLAEKLHKEAKSFNVIEISKFLKTLDAILELKNTD